MSKHVALPLALALGLSFTLAAGAANMDSVYTDLNLNDCLILHADDFGVSFSCPGYKGYPLYVAEGDLRFFVSYGFGALDEPAATQTLSPFNRIHTKLEWRLSNATGDWKPFATILRWFTEFGDSEIPDGEVLIVTKIEPGNTCHVAHIDAKRTPNANEIAREFADTVVADFNCATDDIHLVPN